LAELGHSTRIELHAPEDRRAFLSRPGKFLETSGIPKPTGTRVDDPERALTAAASGATKVFPKLPYRHALRHLSAVQVGLVPTGIAEEADAELVRRNIR